MFGHSGRATKPAHRYILDSAGSGHTSETRKFIVLNLDRNASRLFEKSTHFEKLFFVG